VVLDITGLYFTLDFTAPGKTTINKTLDDGLTLTVGLEPADWALEVVGYADSSKAVPKVWGSASISVIAGTTSSCDVYLKRDFSSGSAGSLSYSFGLPEGVQGWFALYPLDVTERIIETVEEELWETDISASAGGTASAVLAGLPEGAYLAVVDLYHGGSNQAATWTRAVHIAGGDLTALTHTFTTEEDFAGCDPAVGESEATLAAKLDEALGSPSGSYTITLDGTETDLDAFEPQTLQVTGDKDIVITIRGNGKTVQLGDYGSLFTLSSSSGSSLKLVLQDVTLRGRNDNTTSLVRVNSGGTLEMKAGSLITGNTYDSPTSSYGGGVYVANSGTFTMSGGAVSGNSSSTSLLSTDSSYGGGVYVASYGTFTMSGGAVSGNSSSANGSSYDSDHSHSSSSYGGGVYVANYGTFTMSGGAISGNSSSSSYSHSSSTYSPPDSSYGGGVCVAGTFTMSDGAVSDNSSFSDTYYSYGGGVYVTGSGTFTMSGGAVSDNSSAAVHSSYGGGVYVTGGGTFTMNGGAVSDNSSAAAPYQSSSDGSYFISDAYYSSGGGVYVADYGTFTMDGGVISDNSSVADASSDIYSDASFSYGGGVYVANYGTFSMSGGTVNDNILSGMVSHGKEVLVSGTFKMSGDAWPQQVFLSNNTRFITISGPLSGGVVPIDLGITSGASLISWRGKPVLALDSSYSSGNLAALKERFTPGNVKMTDSTYTETAIPAEYTITDSGRLLSPPPPGSGISGIAYSGAWTLESDGRRKSPPTSNNSVTKERVSFTSTGTNAIIRVQLEASSESDRDYAFISALDNDSATYNSNYFTGSRISGEAWVEVAIPVPTAGEHFIEICYRKDSSGRSGSDCAWFMVGESE
jgi:hypothetical protein